MANRKVVPGSLTDAYRRREGDFSPDLVGFQLTRGDALFTLGNFAVTTNVDPKLSRNFPSGTFSEPYCLDTLNLSQAESIRLESNNINATLNIDANNIGRFVYYGSFNEFLRVNIEEIITNWKGSLYITDKAIFSNSVKYTVLGYSYDDITNQSTFTIPTQMVINKFGLDYETTTNFLIDATDISTIELSFSNYEISNEFGQFSVLGYTGATETSNPYIKVVTSGNTFPSLTGTTFGTFVYHLKPKDSVVDLLFFDRLTDFQDILLNRLTYPRYTSKFETPVETESGLIMSVKKAFTWPTTDGYNLDIDGSSYTNFINSFFKVAHDYDSLKTDLVSRRFVAHSIKEFDTPGDDEFDPQARKINKLLRIYGREFDEVKKYTDAIKFANVYTYNKRDNAPDELVKMMARTLGFEAIQSVSNNNLINYIVRANQTMFSGHSREMSIKEVDTELWRRLVINAWWLYESKGTRKVIEFFIKLFGLHDCLVDFDEIVYVAKDKLNRDVVFNEVADLLGIEPESVEETQYPIDLQGFPKTLPNTQDYYFQMDGFWYNGGTEKKVGNNPHFGPYDYGSKYFKKFECFVSEDDIFRPTFTTTINITPGNNIFNIQHGLESVLRIEDILLNDGTGNLKDIGYINQINGLITFGDMEVIDYNNVRISFDSQEDRVVNLLIKGRRQGTIQDVTQTINLFTDYNSGDLEITFEEGLPVTNYGSNYANLMMNNDRVSDGTYVTSAGFTTENSRTGRGSLKLTFNKGISDTCNIPPCPPYKFDREVGLIIADIPNSKASNTALAQMITEDCCEFFYLPADTGQETELSPEQCKDLDGKIDKLREEIKAAKTKSQIIQLEGQIREIEQQQEDGGCFQVTALSRYEKAEEVAVFSGPANTDDPTPSIDQYCYWCPPVREICDVSNLYDLDNPDTYDLFIDKLIEYGYIKTRGEVKDSRHLEVYYSKVIEQENAIIKKYGCTLVYNAPGYPEDYKDIDYYKNNECCKLRGGDWVNIGSGDIPMWKCTKEQPIQCPEGDKLLKEYENGTLSEECCLQNFGEKYLNDKITVTYYDGTSETYQLGELAVGVGNVSGKICTTCPGNVNTVLNDDIGLIYVDSDGNNISRECCTSVYVGGNVTSQGDNTFCKVCPTATVGTDGYVRFESKTRLQTEVLEDCCTADGYVWSNGRCYVCDPNYQPREGQVINGIQYTEIVDSQGGSLSTDCCRRVQEDYKAEENGIELTNVTDESGNNRCVQKLDRDINIYNIQFGWANGIQRPF